jgi:hypothetical protein
VTIAFHMDADQALKFFELCEEFHLETEDERIELLKEMIAAGFDISVFETKRSPEQIAKDYSKHGNVLYLKLGDRDESKIDKKDIN